MNKPVVVQKEAIAALEWKKIEPEPTLLTNNDPHDDDPNSPAGCGLMKPEPEVLPTGDANADHCVDGQDAEQPPNDDPLPKDASFFDRLMASISPFHTPQQVPYATVRHGDRRDNCTLKSKKFKAFVFRLHYKTYGRSLKSRDFRELLEHLESVALFDSPEYAVHIRVAEHDGNIYVDLANPKGQVVKVTSEGWSIITSADCPVKFIRSPRMRPMAVPSSTQCSFDPLWDLLNITDEHHKILIIAWLIGAMQPNGPYPFLILHGEQGSGKSCICRLLRDLIDPSFPSLFSTPSSERDLAIAALKSRLLAFDNISKITDWLSDAFCRLSTGGGFATRALFSDDDEAVFDFTRPVIANGISPFFTRHDVMDRSIFITSSSIPKNERKPESEMRAQWEAARPIILGAIFNAIQCALKLRDTVNLPSLPRMADFSQWVSAAEPALPWNTGDFMKAYNKNRQEIIDNALESDLVASEIKRLVDNGGEWSGTATELLAALNQSALENKKRDKSWPKLPNVLSRQLRRCATFLREKGIDIQISKSGERNISILILPDDDVDIPAQATVDTFEGDDAEVNERLQMPVKAKAAHLQTAKSVGTAA